MLRKPPLFRASADCTDCCVTNALDPDYHPWVGGAVRVSATRRPDPNTVANYRIMSDVTYWWSPDSKWRGIAAICFINNDKLSNLVVLEGVARTCMTDIAIAHVEQEATRS